MNEKISAMLELLNQRRTLELRKYLGDLNGDLEECEIYKKFYDDIKRMVRNSGKTNVISISEVDEKIIKVGNDLIELKGGEKE